MIAATSVGGTRRSNSTSSNHFRSATWPYGAWNTPGSIGPKPAWYFALDAVSETEPYVRPWNAPRNATRYCRLVAKRASLIEPSTASVPELVRKTLDFSFIGAMRASSAHVSAYDGR